MIKSRNHKNKEIVEVNTKKTHIEMFELPLP